MPSRSNRLPSRQWSIVALSSAGMTAVVLSYLLVLVVALACLALPLVLLVLAPLGIGNLLVARLLISAFGLAAGITILASLIPKKEAPNVNGVAIDLNQEPRLAGEINAVAAALGEPMPAEVYLIGDANAFVTEYAAGGGRRRILALGLPLLQMLSIAQFRAVLAHEFAHYYAGDTRMGPWVYNTRRTMARVYQNLGRKSDVLTFLRRWVVVAAPYMLLMGALRGYWQFFMRVTQAISRKQEFRSDELACYLAGSQALVDGLENIRRCGSALPAYWNGVVAPAAMSGFQPELAGGFLRFMQAPRVVKATDDFLARQNEVAKASPMDSHPPLKQRVARAQQLNLPAPEAGAAPGETKDATNAAMISLVNHLRPLEAQLLKKLMPQVAGTELKPLNWETAGADVYVPSWRKQAAGFLPFLATRKLSDLPLLILDPRPLAELVPHPPGARLNPAQRTARALDILYCAFGLCLLDNGWQIKSQPGALALEQGENRVEPSDVLSAIKNGTLSVVQWTEYRAQRGIGDWPLAAPAPEPVDVPVPAEAQLHTGASA
jgi:heat shock protein HtpX